MSLVTSPIGFLRMQPNISEQTIQNISERKHLNDPIYERYGYWVKDMFTNKFGTETVSDLPIWPDLQRAMGHTLQLIIAAELLAILIAVFIGVYSALRQYSVFDYAATTFSFVGPGDACLLARADAAGAVREHLPLVRRAHLLRREPELGRSGERHPLRARPRAAPRAADHRARGREHRAILSLHARLDARGRQLRLRPHRAGEGSRRAKGDDEARLPECAHSHSSRSSR